MPWRVGARATRDRPRGMTADAARCAAPDVQAAGSHRGRTRFHLLHVLDLPGARSVAAEHYAHALVRARRHEVSAILLDARAIVDQHEVERGRGELRSLRAKRLASRRLHERAVPAAVGGARLLECMIGRAYVRVT